MADLRYALYLSAALAAHGFPAGIRDIDETGRYDIRTYRHAGLQVAVNEETGECELAYFGWDIEYRHGHEWMIPFSESTPETVVIAAVQAALLDLARRVAAETAHLTSRRTAPGLVAV